MSYLEISEMTMLLILIVCMIVQQNTTKALWKAVEDLYEAKKDEFP